MDYSKKEIYHSKDINNNCDDEDNEKSLPFELLPGRDWRNWLAWVKDRHTDLWLHQAGGFSPCLLVVWVVTGEIVYSDRHKVLW